MYVVCPRTPVVMVVGGMGDGVMGGGGGWEMGG